MQNPANLNNMRTSALRSFGKFLFILPFFLLAFFIVPATHAQTSISDQDNHANVQKTLYGILSATTCMLSGIDPIDPKGCLVYNPQSQTYSYATTDSKQKIGGVLGFTANSMGQLYLIPISSTSYVKYVADNFGISPKAYAANDGFSQLNGIMQVWTIFRNLSYLFFVLIFVIIGMGVMLRLKIDPRTVMTIQNQIPRLIVGLVLITFSYAIAGFMVDLMWTSTYLVIRLGSQVKLPEQTIESVPFMKERTRQREFNTEKLTNSVVNSPFGFANNLFGADEGLGLIGYAGSITGSIGETVAGLVTPMADAQNEACVLTNIFPWQNNQQNKSFGSCVRGVIYGVVDWITRILGFLIILFAVLIALGRIWWQMIKSFAYIVIYTAIAPIYIAAGLIPGSTMGFGSWVRGLTANLAVYPATVAFFLGAYIFQSTFTDNSFIPPLTGNPAAAGFGYIVSFAILMVAPELINMLRDALKAPASKYIAPSIQRGFGAGAMLPGSVVRGIGHKLWKHDPYGKAIGPVNSWLSNAFYNGIGGFGPGGSGGGSPTGHPTSRTRRIISRIGTTILGKPGEH